MSSTESPELDEYDDEDDLDEVAAPKKLYKGRPGIIALTAVLAELAVIGGVGNQFVAGSVRDSLQDRISSAADYETGGLQALLTYAWRFAPGKGESNAAWGAPFAAIGTLFVLTLFFGWVVSRGSVTFSRIWVSIAALVTAITPFAVMARNLVLTPNSPGPLQSRVGQSVYGYDAFGPALVFGLAMGVIVGLIAAGVAVFSRRTVTLPRPEPTAAAPLNAYGVPTPGYAPPPWQPEPDYREALAVYGQQPTAAATAPTAAIDYGGARTAENGTPLAAAATTELPATAVTEQLPTMPAADTPVPPAVPPEGADELAEPVTAELAPELDTAELPTVPEAPTPEPATAPVAPTEPEDTTPAPDAAPEPAPAPAAEPDPAPTGVLPSVPVHDDGDHTQEFDIEDLPPPQR
jgi:hypothetical protein